MNRNESRELIITILYQIFLHENNKINYEVDEIIKENLEIESQFVKDTVNEIINKKDEIFQIANSYLKDWKIERLGIPDQAILCLGIYELLHTNTPDVVVINEAVNLAKKYSDDKVKNMINGVLDKIYHEKIN